MFQRAEKEIENSHLGEGFVYLHDVLPNIQFSPRYAGEDNFIGRPIDGYHESYVVLSQPLAHALAAAQQEVVASGFELVIYDAYRPQRATEDFYAWSCDATQIKMQEHFYPTFQKEALFENGFIARRSAHSRGAAVDLTLIVKGHKLFKPDYAVRLLEDNQVIPFIDDGTVDMGTSFDLFHEASEVESTLVPLVAQDRRQYLQTVMKNHGFTGYKKEWWHFQLMQEPFPDTYFDFPIA